MTKDDMKRAIDAAAASHMAMLFDVLCREIVGGSEEDEIAAVGRFMAGVALIDKAKRLALADGGES